MVGQILSVRVPRELPVTSGYNLSIRGTIANDDATTVLYTFI